MFSSRLALLGLCLFTAVALACSDTASSPLAPSDGSTLKVTAPAAQSPVSDQQVAATPVTFTAAASTFTTGTATPLQYRFQVLQADGTTVVEESSLRNEPTWTMAAVLNDNTKYTWRCRAENATGGFGPWSAVASFLAPVAGVINDPLTNGTTIGTQIGGQFIPGQGWQSLGQQDGIDYDLPPCPDCTLEFDLTNIGKMEGVTLLKDLKFISMGEAWTFNDFGGFRDHPWKMHLEQRSDGDGTGMKIVWRNGAAGEGEPGDHVNKVDPAVNWQSSEKFHFELSWSPAGFSVKINGEEWFEDGWGGNAYLPPNHRISLGCRPRGDSFTGAIYSNVKVRRNS